MQRQRSAALPSENTVHMPPAPHTSAITAPRPSTSSAFSDQAITAKMQSFLSGREGVSQCISSSMDDDDIRRTGIGSTLPSDPEAFAWHAAGSRQRHSLAPLPIDTWSIRTRATQSSPRPPGAPSTSAPFVDCSDLSYSVDAAVDREAGEARIPTGRVIDASQLPAVPSYQIKKSKKLSNQQRALNWLIRYGKVKFGTMFAKTLAEWGVKVGHVGTCVLLPAA